MVALVAACGGEVGTIQVMVVGAPDGELLGRIDRVRVSLSEPATVVEAERDGQGSLAVDLEVAAEGGGGIITLEGFDAGGERIALGLSPALPIVAVDAQVVLYVGAPLGFAEAPVELDPPRSELGGALLPYGAILVGGRTADGSLAGELVVYNAYDHALQLGLPLPEARARPTVLTGQSNLVYVFGGTGPDDTPSSDAWAFDTTIAPAGLYAALGSTGDIAASGASGAYIGGERFLLATAPAAILDGVLRRVDPLDDSPALAGGEAVRLGTTIAATVLVAGLGVGETGAVLLRGEELMDLDAPVDVQRSGHATLLLPDGRALLVGGQDEAGIPLRSAVLFDPADQRFSVLDDFLAVGRPGAAIAGTADHILVTGGAGDDGAPLGDAELFDASTLDPLGAVPLVAPRTGARALTLPNRQVLLAGGTGADGEPVGTLELFTPRE